jgi:prophage tail gpP-like protein
VLNIKISIDQIDLLINDDYTPTDALNTLNANSEITLIDYEKLVNEVPTDSQNISNFKYDKSVIEYKNIIKKYHIKLEKLKKLNRNIDESSLIKFKKYVDGIRENLKLSTEVYNNKSNPNKTTTVLDILATKNPFGGNKSKKTMKSKKTKKSKKTMKSKKTKKSKKSTKSKR